MNSKNILVVDDDPIIRQICGANLETEGYSVKSAENGEEALQSIKSVRPDLVVLDRMMPKLAGDGMLDRLRKTEQTKNLPVIFLTAKGTMQDVIDGLRLGANDYLIKPFSVADLIERVGSVLERHYLINGDEEDWFARSGSVSSRHELSFKLPEDIPRVIYALCRDLRTKNVKGLKLGLYEAIANAVYHGNLELDSSIKEKDNGFENYEAMANARRNQNKYIDRKVNITLELNGGLIKFVITDDGDGFDWKKIPAPDSGDLLALSGRGIMLMNFYYDSVEWNDKGSQVTLTCRPGSSEKKQ